ncbi:MAG: YihY/virulence factor BrkB family protein [Clostridiales bacterium]|jgi:membrane protein|nr:YihY/virulence factor BrkB family protein [Clostridiales bacterium]
MKTIIKFITRLIKELKEDEILSMSYEVTYKLLLSIFPFIIFVISILGFLELDSGIIFDMVSGTLPKEGMEIINVFLDEVIDSKSTEILSTSLLLSIMSSSSGFLSVISCINKAYGFEDKRNFVIKRIVAVLMVFAFVSAIVVSILLLIFGDSIRKLLISYDIVPTPVLNYMFSFSSYLFAMLILFLIAILIFKLASSRELSMFSLMPGAFVCVLFWVASSKIFNIYVNNFSKYSKVYGSIGSVFILMFWINLISFFLLLGSEINIVIQKYNYLQAYSGKGHKAYAKRAE